MFSGYLIAYTGRRIVVLHFVKNDQIHVRVHARTHTHTPRASLLLVCLLGSLSLVFNQENKLLSVFYSILYASSHDNLAGGVGLHLCKVTMQYSLLTGL